MWTGFVLVFEINVSDRGTDKTLRLYCLFVDFGVFQIIGLGCLSFFNNGILWSGVILFFGFMVSNWTMSWIYRDGLEFRVGITNKCSQMAYWFVISFPILFITDFGDRDGYSGYVTFSPAVLWQPKVYFQCWRGKHQWVRMRNSLFSVVRYQGFHLAFICCIFFFQGLQRFCTEHKIKLSKVGNIHKQPLISVFWWRILPSFFILNLWKWSSRRQCTYIREPFLGRPHISFSCLLRDCGWTARSVPSWRTMMLYSWIFSFILYFLKECL